MMAPVLPGVFRHRMRASRLIVPALVVIASGAIAVAALVAATRWAMPVELSGPIGDGTANRRERAAFTTRGFHGPEFDATTARQFSWTGAQAVLRVPHIDRRQGYRVRLRITAGRGPATPPPPEVVVSVDGVVRMRAASTNEPQTIDVDIPPAASRTLLLAMDVSNTFVPGPGDRRTLGVVVEDVAIAPVSGSWTPDRAVALRFGLVAMALAAVIVAAGFSAGWALALSTATIAALVWALVRDGAFLGIYIDRLMHIAAGASVAGVVAAVARRRWPAAFGAPGWGLAAGVTIVAAAAKLAYFGHPNVALADSIFQVHRAQNVVAGQYFFTSVTPRPFFEFPYAIALYVTALPLWDWFPTELDRVRLLRGITIVADATVGLAMYFAIARTSHGHRAALAFAALWPFARAPLSALCTSNLTNLYGQALFGMAMAIVLATAAVGAMGRAAAAALLVLFSVAFLSHFSTLSVGIPLACGVGVLLVAAGRGATRRVGGWVLCVVLAASAVSYVAYYRHFHPVYQATLDRIVAGDGASEERSMAAPPGTKAARWLRTTRLEFGWPAIVTAVVGAFWSFRRSHQAGALVLAGWTAGWLAFAVLGIVTPVEMRANLAAAPLVLALGAVAIGMLASTSTRGAVLAAILGAAIVWDGYLQWMRCLTG